jgi:uncharacterized coiled-coil protein SlyX
MRVEFPTVALRKGESMKVEGYGLLVCLLLGFTAASVGAQTAAPPASPGAANQEAARLEQKVDAISATLAATQLEIERSQRQVQQLQQELLELRRQMASTAAAASAPSSESSSIPSSESPNALPLPPASDAVTPALEERLQTLEAEVKLHDQTKVESISKYPVRLTGLILFNGFLNKGVPDNTDLPAVALRKTSTSGNGDLGAGLRQTILGVQGDGPRIAGAHTSANVNIDFFSGDSYTSYGTSAGVVRMRTASVDFDWTNDSIEVGIVPPLISPLSPTSYATVAEPSLAGAGNLWTWAPQLRYAHRFPLENGNHLQFEFGLWDSPSAGYNANQLFRTASPAELAEQPAYETRISYAVAGERGLQLGISGYYSRQAYPGYGGYQGSENIDSWAGTADWRVPLARHFEMSGEGYRGRSIGGLGGGVYKDAVTGTDPISGATDLHPLNAIGGWTQFKMRFSSSLETNFSIGQDDGFARDFHAVVLPPTDTAAQLRARSKMAVANLIFRPKTYIILSPEYRRIWTWPINGPAATLDIFTLSMGYQF